MEIEYPKNTSNVFYYIHSVNLLRAVNTMDSNRQRCNSSKDRVIGLWKGEFYKNINLVSLETLPRVDLKKGGIFLREEFLEVSDRSRIFIQIRTVSFCKTYNHQGQVGRSKHGEMALQRSH